MQETAAGGATVEASHGNGHQLNRMGANTSPCLFYDDWQAFSSPARAEFLLLSYSTGLALPHSSSMADGGDLPRKRSPDHTEGKAFVPW